MKSKINYQMIGRFTLVLVLMLTILFTGKSVAQVTAWDFNPANGNETSANATTIDANLNTSVISKGSGLSNPAGANAFPGSFGAVGYSTSSASLATAISNQEYLSFTISAKPNFKVSLTTINANFLRSTNNAPNSFQWQYSLNGFATAGSNIGSTITYSLSTTGSASDGTAQPQINLSSISGLQNVVSGITITIRVYGWGAGNEGSTFSLGRLPGNDLAIGGTVETTLLAPLITTQPSGHAFCQGQTQVSFIAAASGDPVPAVQWQKNTVNIPGANSQTFTITSPSPGDNGSYRAVFTNSQGSATTNAVTLAVSPFPVASATSSNINCFAANDGTITILASGGTAPYTFSVDGINFFSETSPGTRLFTGLLPDTPYPVKVKDNNGCLSK